MNLRNFFMGFALIFVCLFGMMAGAASAQTVSVPSVQLSSPLPDFGQVNRILGQVADTGDKVLHFVSDFAPRYWEANVNQVKLESSLFFPLWWSVFSFSALALCISLFSYLKADKMSELASRKLGWRDDNPDVDRNEWRQKYSDAKRSKTVCGISSAVFGSFLAIAILFGIFLGPTMYLQGQNPQFYAIKNIINQVSE
jgi:hypothetical protein